MTTITNRVNDKLQAISNNQTFSQPAAQAAVEQSQQKFAETATLFGKEANQNVAGLVGIESKLDGAGTTLGNTLVTATKDAVSIGNVMDPSKINIDLGGGAKSVSSAVSSNLGLGEPVQTLQFEQLGGSSIAAIEQCAADAKSKASALQSKISSVASAVSPSGASSIASVISATKADIIAKATSSVPEININAPTLESVKDPTGISGLVAEAGAVVNTLEKSTSAVLTDIANGVNSAIEQFDKAASDLVNFVEDTAIKTGQGLLQDMAESITKTASNLIGELVNGVKLSDDKMSSLLQGVLGGDPAQKGNTVYEIVKADVNLTEDEKKVINNVTDIKSVSDLTNKLEVGGRKFGLSQEQTNKLIAKARYTEDNINKINTTISGQKVVSTTEFYTGEIDIQANINRYKGARSAFDAFTYVDSKEELGAEFRKFKRSVNEVVVHASETYTNQNIGCEELHIAHNEKGFDGIQYHYVIRRDGRLQRGRPVDKQSEATNIKTHSQYCIDVCLVGGLNCPTGTPDPLEYRSSQSFTIAQFKTLEALLEAFYRRYPGGQVMGHNALEDNAQDPYFDVVTYAETLFRKKSVYEDLLNDIPQTSANLIKKQPV